MIHKIEFIGKTKDGSFGREVNIEAEPGNAVSYKAFKVITENGYVDIEVALDPEGRLKTVIVERTNIGI